MKTKNELQAEVKRLQFELDVTTRQLTKVGEDLARTTILVQTQDGEIGRLTQLNDRMFAMIDRLIMRINSCQV